MIVGRKYLIVDKGFRNRRPTPQAYIRRFSAKSKTLKLPLWYPTQVVDKTKGVKVLRFGRKLRHQQSTVLPPEEATRYRKRLQYGAQYEEPWEYRYERDEPYTVTFWGASIYQERYTYWDLPGTTYPVNSTNRTEVRVSTVNRPLKSCLKKNLKYPQSSNKYSGYWFGIGFPTYIRGQVRRAREQEEREAVKRRREIFNFLLKYPTLHRQEEKES
jgi:hypothetical protein